MHVKAAQGLKVPMENKPRKYITETDAVEVPGTAYYTRLINDGSLIRVDDFTESGVTDGQ